jgi:hypothetical protein
VHRTRVALVLVALACLLTACGDGRSSIQQLSVATAGDPRAEGDAAAQRGDWPTAVAKYALALEKSPDDLLLHFAYGSALTRVDRDGDAMEQFTWVVRRGDSSRPEVATARKWLEDAGALTRTEERPADTPAPTAAAPATPPAEVAMGLLEGKTTWPGVGPDDRHRLSVHLRLNGDSEATATIRHRLNVEIGTGFTWQKVPAGRYRLLGESKGVTLWDVPVVIEKDKVLNVELSPANAAVPPAAFPPS